MNVMNKVKNLMLLAAVGVAMFATTMNALADKLHLKDGRVLDGEIVRQDGDFVVFKIKGKSEAEFFEMKDIARVEKESATKPAETKPAPKAEEKKEDAKPAVKADEKKDETKPATEPSKETPASGEKSDAKSKGRVLTGKPNRIAVLNFGPPGSWQGKAGDMVGVTISAKAFADAVPMLEKDNVDTVVIHVNSGGGYGLEVDRFHELFDTVYKRKFRLVAWVESAISAAAMSPWVISEFYMKPEGNIGACTGWSGNLVAVKGVELERYLIKMAEASRMAGRDPKIMRSMQILEPLSYTIDDQGQVTWFQDTTSGKVLLNPAGQILTLNALDAVKCKFATGIAGTKDELAKAMGLSEYEFVGQDAAKYIDEYMVKAHRIDKEIGELAVKYRLALATAQQLAPTRGDPRFGAELGKARQALNELRKWVAANPNFRFHIAGQLGANELNEGWFAAQEDFMKQLAEQNKEANSRRDR